MGVGTVPVDAAPACDPLDQITITTGGGGDPELSISGDGRRVAFHSFDDITGDNADGSGEIFLWEAAGRTTTQLTASGVGGLGSLSPSISDAGTRVVFRSDRDLIGDNPDGNTEIFLFDTTTSVTTQLTSTVGEITGGAVVTGDGRRVVFVSSADLTGDNVDGSSEVFAVEIVGGSFTQLTSGSGGFVEELAPSEDGTRVAFRSSDDLTGDNPDGNAEIFLIAGPTGGVVQVTDTTSGVNAEPSIVADGSQVLFTSNRDLVGDNPDQNHEIFRFDTASGSTAQVGTNQGFNGTLGPSVSADGTRFAYTSDANLGGRNPDTNSELFLFDEGGQAAYPVTSTTGLGAIRPPALSADGEWITFTSDRDLVGDNSDLSPEVFLVRCPRPATPEPPPAAQPVAVTPAFTG
jgi:Tol biopolymer transport system component